MIYYENCNGTRMDLDKWPAVIDDITELYGKEWKYEATENATANRTKLERFYRTGISKKITLQIYADTEKEYCEILNQLSEITDIDIIEQTPGKIWVGDYYLECFITKLEPKEYDDIFYTVDVDATIEAFTPSGSIRTPIHSTATGSAQITTNDIRKDMGIVMQTECPAITSLIHIIPLQTLN